MQWLHRSVRITLRDINKKGVEIGERQNRCRHEDSEKPLHMKHWVAYLNVYKNKLYQIQANATC